MWLWFRYFIYSCSSQKWRLFSGVFHKRIVKVVDDLKTFFLFPSATLGPVCGMAGCFLGAAIDASGVKRCFIIMWSCLNFGCCSTSATKDRYAVQHPFSNIRIKESAPGFYTRTVKPLQVLSFVTTKCIVSLSYWWECWLLFCFIRSTNLHFNWILLFVCLFAFVYIICNVHFYAAFLSSYLEKEVVI